MSLPEVYVIHPNGCVPLQNATINGMKCKEARGGIFYHNSSTSYEEKNTYNFSTGHKEKQTYNFGKNAAFRNFGFPELPGSVGWDTITLNQPTRDGVNSQIHHLIVAEMSTRHYSLLGMLGLDIRPTNLSDIGRARPQDNLIRKLKEYELIPSLSWAYTAGSHGCKQPQAPEPCKH
jgi:hypothetical protein